MTRQSPLHPLPQWGPTSVSGGGRDSGPLDLNFNLTSSPGSDIKTQCHLAQVLPPVRAQERKMERQTHPLPFLSKPIWWLEPQLQNKNTMVGEGRGSARLALFCVKEEWCFMKPELVASSPPHKPDTTIEAAGLFEARKH
ncbi:hypothetical protein Q8A67_019726 [Cirrhinus molitorella]|uniref:Uncharacterized protein n=1 Tax=Cirrhinus molitorella TaxID=172907 RepID=A0AA88TFC8_9TELE|nr:hypothetical protein Q8A67_019726 [Cirrhinus molitorella]